MVLNVWCYAHEQPPHFLEAFEMYILDKRFIL